MKKMFRFLVIALCASLAFSSCKKDKEEENEEIKFSEKTVEQNKADIQQAGIDLTSELKAMQDGKAFNAILQLSNLQKNGSLKSYVLKSTDVDSKLKGYEVPDELAQTIDEQSGVYVWNNDTQSFEKTAEAKNAVTYKFPYSLNSTSNDCEMNATVEYAANVKNLPAKVTCSLKIGGTECLSLSYVGTFTSEGYPTSVVESFTIDDFSLTTEYNRSDSKFSTAISFLHGTKTLLNTSATIEGALTDANVNKMMEDEVSEEEEYDFYSNVVSKVNFSTQVMNIKFTGDVSTKAFVEIAKAEDQQDPSTITKEDMQKMVDDANNAITCYVYNAKDNAKIADVKFFVVKDDYEDYNGEEFVTIENYVSEPKLVFADESSMSFEDYFEEGFSKLESSFDELMDDLNTSLSKYDLN